MPIIDAPYGSQTGLLCLLCNSEYAVAGGIATARDDFTSTTRERLKRGRVLALSPTRRLKTSMGPMGPKGPKGPWGPWAHGVEGG